MRITRYASLTEQQFLGCAAAFVDSLAGELNGAALSLRQLEGRPKGGAFAYEMTLDRHRYGALLVLDRWAELVRAFGPHVELRTRRGIIGQAAARVAGAEEILDRVNQLLDAAERYTGEVVSASVVAFQSVAALFSEEREAADEAARLGPLLPEDYRQARRVFFEDLAAR